MIRKLTMLKRPWIVFVAARLFAADPRIGAWKVVSPDSALDPPRVFFITPQALVFIDAHTVDSTYRRGDQIADRDRSVISADGQPMTLARTGVFGTGER